MMILFHPAIYFRKFPYFFDSLHGFTVCVRILANIFLKGDKMSGHSKWHSIKYKKAAQDAKRGKIFTKIIRELSVATRISGSDPETNPRLRKAIADAKAVNMPADNIKRAIQKGAGELEGVNYEEVVYEGYGPGGVAILVETLTDNKNRTVSELRHIFSRNGGNIGESGCVAWMFKRKGYIVVDKTNASEDDILEIVLNARKNNFTTHGLELMRDTVRGPAFGSRLIRWAKPLLSICILIFMYLCKIHNPIFPRRRGNVDFCRNLSDRSKKHRSSGGCPLAP